MNLRDEEMRRRELQAGADAVALQESPGWANLDAEAQALLEALRESLERGLEREDYLRTIGRIQGLREALDMPRKAQARAAAIIEERDGDGRD